MKIPFRDTLLQYALMAQEAYSAKPDIGIENTASRAIVRGNAIAFPGTNNIACALADMQFDVIQTMSLGRLHKGFWDAYLAIATDLLKQSPEIIVGHSLGGALALIYGGALCILGTAPKFIYAFEPPMVSVDSILGDVLKAHGVQVTITHNGCDIVPCIPHLDENWQQPGEVTELCTTGYPYPDISWDAVANIEDHLISNVIRSIQQLEPQK